VNRTHEAPLHVVAVVVAMALARSALRERERGRDTDDAASVDREGNARAIDDDSRSTRWMTHAREGDRARDK